MRYQIIDVYHNQTIKRYIAKCLKPHSPQFIEIESQRTLCLHADIIDFDPKTAEASWITGEPIALHITHSFDAL